MSIFHAKEKDGTINVIVCGKVSREPQVKSGSKGNRIQFSVAYGKQKYMDCEAWEDSTAGDMAGCLEKGDVVLVSGTHRSWEYNGKEYQCVTVDFLIPMSMPDVQAVAPAPAPEAKPATSGNYKSGKFSDLDDDSEDDDDLPFDSGVTPPVTKGEERGTP